MRNLIYKAVKWYFTEAALVYGQNSRMKIESIM